MLLKLFKPSPLLDSNSLNWILDTFSWALEHFDLQVFKEESKLILPTNDFYPGSVNNIHQMAQSVFDKTLKYAGLENWPIVLIAPQDFDQQTLPQLSFSNKVRGQDTKVRIESGDVINVSYNPNQINQPQDLVASFAQAFATILIIQSGKQPPGGAEFFSQAVDLVACFMGFGVMFANTAYQFKGGCGSCFNPYANRSAALSESEVLYCLAIFSTLKSIKINEVTPHLKKHLRADFKKAYKELTASLPDSNQPLLLAAAL